MIIRKKLFFLLLTITLLPVIAGGTINNVSRYKLGTHLSENIRDILLNDAQQQLKLLVDDYAKALDRGQITLELAISMQAEAVEKFLTAETSSNKSVYFSEDYESGESQPASMELSTKHFKADETGKIKPIPISFSEQVFFAPSNSDKSIIKSDILRLSNMPDVYKHIYNFCSDLIYWQYTSLESGLHSSYPGHGGYPEEYDPRTRHWYREAREKEELTWISPMPEVSTRTIILTVTKPLFLADGTFAGVTAIDVPLNSITGELNLPPQWNKDASSIFVFPYIDDHTNKTSLFILSQKSYSGHNWNWKAPLKPAFVYSEDTKRT